MNELCSFLSLMGNFYLIVSVVLVASEIHTHVVYEGQTNTAEACDSTQGVYNFNTGVLHDPDVVFL